MKKASKKTKQIEITSIQGYHGGNFVSESYAFEGFKSNKLITSDRFIKLTENFERVDGKPMKAFGFEIETQCWGIRNTKVYAEVLNKIVLAGFRPDMFKLQKDGSLASAPSSAEIISQPMTKEAIRNLYPDFKAMYDVFFPAFDISCTKTGDCGMHINISNGLFGAKEEAQELAIKKLLYIVNKHYKLFCALTNRDIHNTGYCQQMIKYANKENAKNVDLGNMTSNHGVCFNGGHYKAGRIELRIVGGQKNFACFRNTVESVFHVIEAVKKLGWNDCDDLTKIFAGCNQYVFDRLATKCFQENAITIEQLNTIKETVQREELL